MAFQDVAKCLSIPPLIQSHGKYCTHKMHSCPKSGCDTYSMYITKLYHGCVRKQISKRYLFRELATAWDDCFVLAYILSIYQFISDIWIPSVLHFDFAVQIVLARPSNFNFHIPQIFFPETISVCAHTQWLQPNTIVHSLHFRFAFRE